MVQRKFIRSFWFGVALADFRLHRLFLVVVEGAFEYFLVPLHLLL